MHDPELRNSPWQDLLTLPAAAGAGAGGGRVRQAPAAAGTETILEASTALALCPDPERDYPGGLAEFCQDLTLRVYNPCPVRSW